MNTMDILSNSYTGYIIIGILSFILGISATLFSIKIKKLRDIEGKNKEND